MADSCWIFLASKNKKNPKVFTQVAFVLFASEAAYMQGFIIIIIIIFYFIFKESALSACTLADWVFQSTKADISDY